MYGSENNLNKFIFKLSSNSFCPQVQFYKKNRYKFYLSISTNTLIIIDLSILFPEIPR